jgi:hypothetical protein
MCDAVINRQGQFAMTTSTMQQQETKTAPTKTPLKPATPRKASAAALGPHVAPAKAKSGKKASPAKRGAKGRKQPVSAARQGSKTLKVLDLLQRPGGATLKDIMKATDWQAHSVRGFLSGTVGKKMRLTIESTKSDAGDRVYRLAK